MAEYYSLGKDILFKTMDILEYNLFLTGALFLGFKTLYLLS